MPLKTFSAPERLESHLSVEGLALQAASPLMHRIRDSLGLPAELSSLGLVCISGAFGGDPAFSLSDLLSGDLEL